MPTPAEELRAAVAKLRNLAPLAPVPGSLEPIAEWLEHEAQVAANAHLWTEREPCAWCGEPASHHALAVARGFNGGQP